MKYRGINYALRCLDVGDGEETRIWEEPVEYFSDWAKVMRKGDIIICAKALMRAMRKYDDGRDTRAEEEILKIVLRKYVDKKYFENWEEWEKEVIGIE